MFASPKTEQRLLPPSLCPDAYVTDGIRLFRVVESLLDPWHGESAHLEDCLTLRSCFYPVDELRLRGFRMVRQRATASPATA
jgi:hypothetical protein